MSKKTLTFFICIVLIALGAVGYWLYTKSASHTAQTGVAGNGSSGGSGNIFSPLAGSNLPGTGTSGTGSHGGTTGTPTGSSGSSTAPISPLPTLRELSTVPVGGMVASTSGTSTIVRWIDRGTGYVYQASSNSLGITELSNTTIPMIYESFWNKKANAFIFQSLADDTDTVTPFYAVLSASTPTTGITSTSTASTSSTNTPFQLRGTALPSNTSALALNPEGTAVFTLATNGSGADSGSIGYTSQFDGSKKTQVFTTPLSDLNIQWPTDTTLALTTKGFSTLPGFLYFVSPKTGTLTEILGNIDGLDTLTNPDASQVLYSASAGASTDAPDSLALSVYNVKEGSSEGLAFNTLPEKCIWSALNKDDLICAVPSQIPSAAYPEAWYQGTVSLTDSLWEVNVTTGEVHEIADLLSLSGRPIDAENLTLDPKENFLYFINKRDLSLWSISLNSQN